MCYTVYLSTDSNQDLAKENSELISFEWDSVVEPFRSMLLYANQWYVGSKSGCSCTFRHLHSVDLGFGEPVTWYEEDEDEIAATLLFIKIVRSLIKRGYQVDCVDAWNGAARGDIREVSINLDEINDAQFRFFENHHFRFDAGN